MADHPHGRLRPFHAHQGSAGPILCYHGRLRLQLGSKTQTTLVSQEFSYLYSTLAAHCDALVSRDVYAPPIRPHRTRNRLELLLEFVLRP